MLSKPDNFFSKISFFNFKFTLTFLNVLTNDRWHYLYEPSIKKLTRNRSFIEVISYRLLKLSINIFIFKTSC